MVWSVLGGRRPGSSAAGGGTFGRVTGSPAAGWRVGAGSRGGVREEGAASAGRGLVVGAGTFSRATAGGGVLLLGTGAGVG